MHLLVYKGDYCHVYVIEVGEILDVVLCPSLNIHNISQAGFVSCLQMEQIMGRAYSWVFQYLFQLLKLHLFNLPT